MDPSPETSERNVSTLPPGVSSRDAGNEIDIDVETVLDREREKRAPLQIKMEVWPQTAVNRGVGHSDDSPDIDSRRVGNRTRRWFIVSCLAMIAIFAMDLLMPLGVVGGVHYLAVILLTLLLPSRRSTVQFALACSGLTILGMVFSPPGGVLWQVIFNRALSIFAIWITAIIVIYRKMTEQALAESRLELQEAHDDLESRVDERTKELLTSNKSLESEIEERLVAEKSLRESEERFELAVRGTSDGIWDWDIETGRTYWSPRLKELLGYRDDEIAASRSAFESLLHPEDRARTLAALQQHRDDGVPYDIEYRLKKKNGESCWFHDRGQAIRDDEGRAVRMAGSIRDISQRKQAELELGEYRRQLEMLMGNLPGMVYRCRNSEDWSLIFASEGCFALTGYRPEAYISKDSIFPDLIHPDDRRRVWDDVQVAIEGRRPYQLTYRIVDAGGEEKIVWEQGGGVFDDEGNLMYLEGFISDITSLHEAERVLRESEQRTRAMFEQAAVGIALYDLDGRWLQVNEKLCAILEYSQEELVGRSCREFTHPDDREAQAELLGRLRNAELKSASLEKRYLRKNGSPVWTKLTASPVCDEKGEPEYIIAVIEDITERKRVEQREIGLNRILEESLNEIYVFDAETLNFIQVNRGARENLGYTMEELESLTPYALKPKFTRESFERLIEPLRSGAKDVLKFHTVLQRKDGSSYDVDVNLQHSRLGDRSVFVGIILDMTERNEFNQALHTSRTLHAEAQRIAHLGHWDLDIVTNALSWSDEIYRIFGLHPWAFGATYQAFLDTVHPDDQQFVINAVDDAVRSGAPYSIDHRIVRPDGEVRFVHEEGEITRDDTGSPRRMIGTVLDITDRKLTDERLKMTQFAIDHSSTATYWIRADGLFAYINDAACRSLGYSREAMLTMSVPDIAPDFPLEAWPKRWEDMKQAGTMTFESRQRTKDGRVFPVEITTNYLKFNNEEYLWVFSRDITEQRNDERRQKLLMRELDHRVKNNLASVLSLADQTIGLASNLEDFRSSFTGRIKAMAVAHEMLAQQHWHGAEIHKLIESMIEPHRRDESDRFRLQGERIMIGPRIAPSITMVINELLTNAAKYGALSVPDGVVSIAWSLEKESPDDRDMLHLHWEETGGPTVRKPERVGFGTKLIDQMVKFQHKGWADIRYEPTGVRCELRIPLHDEEPPIDGIAHF